MWHQANLDQRAAVRFAYACPATITTGSRTEAGTVVNLSVWGCAVRSRVTVAQGDRVSLTLALPDEELPLVLELNRVRWCSPGLVGIEFLNMAASSRSRLRHRLLALRAFRLSIRGRRGGVGSRDWTGDGGKGLVR